MAENIICPQCGSQDVELIIEIETVNYYRCNNCGCQYATGIPIPEE